MPVAARLQIKIDKPLEDVYKRQEVCGTNQDGSINEEYCIYCYKDGTFVDDCTMDEMIEGSVRHMKESGMLKEQNRCV